MLVPLMLKERPEERLYPWSEGQTSPEAQKYQLTNWTVMVKSLFRVFFLPVGLMIGVATFVYAIGTSMLNNLMPVFTVQKLGWTDVEFSHIFSMVNLIAGVLGMFLGGAMIDLFGRIRMISLYAIALAILVMGFSFMDQFWENEYFLIGFVVVFAILGMFMTIAFLAIAMQLCWKRVAATQFTLYMAIHNMGLSVGAWLMGELKTYWDWPLVFRAYLPLIILFLVIMQFVNFDRHQKGIQALEQRYS